MARRRKSPRHSAALAPFEPLANPELFPRAVCASRPFVHLGIPQFQKVADMQPEMTEKKQPKSFEALTPELSTWILDFTHSMGFARTTPVQAMAIPLLMGNKDLVVEVYYSRCV